MYINRKQIVIMYHIQKYYATGFLNLPESQIRAAYPAAAKARQPWHANARSGMNDCQTTRQYITVQTPPRPTSELDTGPLFPTLLKQVSGYSVAPMNNQNQTSTKPVSLRFLQEGNQSDRNFTVCTVVLLFLIQLFSRKYCY